MGTGLIGGSIGLGLRALGWHVTGRDADPAASARALELGALDEIGDDADADLTFVATPVGVIADEVRRALADTQGLVTDVGSVKTPMLELMNDPRYVGGHPMAGSELEGVDGARANLFEGATWVLTPVGDTDDQALTTIRSVISSFGAEVVALPPERHDTMVALVSHVPHLDRSDAHEVGRRTINRAAGAPASRGWRVSGHDADRGGPPRHMARYLRRESHRDRRRARSADRRAVGDARRRREERPRGADADAGASPLGAGRRCRPASIEPDVLTEVRVPIPDRTGVLAQITTLATELDVSISDIEIAHSAEGREGVLILLVETEQADRLVDGLGAAGFKPSARPLQ